MSVQSSIFLLPENDPPSLYIATSEGLKRFSLDTAVVETVANSSDDIDGVAFDWLRDKIYWSSMYKVFRVNRNGTAVETVLDTQKCKCNLSSFVNQSA